MGVINGFISVKKVTKISLLTAMRRGVTILGEEIGSGQRHVCTPQLGLVFIFCGSMSEITIYYCPHCGMGIEILQINCAIFRCGVYKKTGLQIDPHMSKKEISLIEDDIYGCGKPFQFNGKKLVQCEYI